MGSKKPVKLAFPSVEEVYVYKHTAQVDIVEVNINERVVVAQLEPKQIADAICEFNAVIIDPKQE